MQNLYEELVQDFPYDSSVLENLREQSSTSQSDAEVLLFMEAVDLPASDEEAFFKQLRRLHTSLSTTDALLNVPKGLEARRRISFFCNSLFMTMPRAPQVLFQTLVVRFCKVLCPSHSDRSSAGL